MDEAIAAARDWALLSPSPRSFFANFLNDELGPKPISDCADERLNEAPLRVMTNGHGGSEDFVDGCGRVEVGDDSSALRCELSMGGVRSRGGLVERLAARSGFNAPKLNTSRVRFMSMGSSSSELPSPFVTIPPGLSPATLLDSPIFLNSVTQPSPTTGKLPLSQNSLNGLISVPDSDNKLFDDGDDKDLFTKSDLELNLSYFQTAENKQASLDQQVSIHSPSRDTQPESEEQKMEISSVSLGQVLEDGYNWRKYGQKQVKGSEYPRGYYKCTQPNCPARKKIERSQEGHIIDVVYKGIHNHLKPPPNRRTVLLPSQEQTSGLENQAQLTSTDVWPTAMPSEVTRTSDGTEVSSHVPRAQMGHHFESSVSLEGEEVDQSNHRTELIDDNIAESEYNSKRRKLDTSLMDINHSSRTNREPRVVVQTTSDVDVLDDGYRWRKYGQKVVKGNPNPRSYYKCTSAGCNVRKHVERASHDLTSVITTYEGRHNHDVPVARTSGGHAVSVPSNIQPENINATPEPYQARDNLSQLTVHPSRVPFQSLEGSQMESMGGFCLGLGQLGVGNNAMIPGLGSAMAMKMVPQMQLSLGHQSVREGGYLMQNSELKAEPNTQMCIQIPNAASLYRQMISRFPLGS